MTGAIPRDGETYLVTFRAEYRELGGDPVFELPEAGIDWWPASAAVKIETIERPAVQPTTSSVHHPFAPTEETR